MLVGAIIVVIKLSICYGKFFPILGLLLPATVNNWEIAHQVFCIFFLLNYIESAKNIEYQIAVTMMALFMATKRGN